MINHLGKIEICRQKRQMDTQMDKGNVTNCYKLLNLGGAYTNVHYSKCQLFCGFKLFHDNKLGYDAE